MKIDMEGLVPLEKGFHSFNFVQTKPKDENYKCVVSPKNGKIERIGALSDEDFQAVLNQYKK